MLRGGPQGSSFTSKLVKTYHTDMEDFIAMAMSFFFCWRSCCCNSCSNWNSFRWSIFRFRTSITFFLECLEFYAILSVQPINYVKTNAMFSARAISYPNPMPVLKFGNEFIEWVALFKYLGCWISTKLDSGEHHWRDLSSYAAANSDN